MLKLKFMVSGLTGAGFGGGIINIVEEDVIDSIDIPGEKFFNKIYNIS